MNIPGFDDVQERYGFDEWREAKPGGAALFIWRFALGGQELPGHRPLRIDVVDVQDLPPTTQSLWQPEQEEGDRVLVRMDVSEAPSVTSARESLLHTLAQFQSPLVERIAEGPGDVAFGVGDNAVVFVRGNIVMAVRNAGDKVKSVDAPARDLDQLLRDGPGAERSSVRPTIRRAEVEPVRGRVRLTLEAEDPLGRHVWFRLSASSGEFLAEESGVVFVPEAVGKQAIEIQAVNENLGVAVQQVEFTV